MKRKKEEAKKLLMTVNNNGSGANTNTNGDLKRSKKPSTPNSAIDRKNNATSPSKQPVSGGVIDDGNSKKRMRKNPVEPSSAIANKGNSDKSNRSVIDGKSPQKETNNSISPTTKQGRNATKLSRLDSKEDKAPKTSMQSNQKESAESLHKSTDTNQIAGDSTSPKKKRKKKKNNSDKSNSTTEQTQETTSKPDPNNKPIANSIANKDTTKSTPQTKPSPTQKLKISLPKSSQMSTLQKAFLERLTSSRFRELNEELYTHSSQHSFEYFTDNPELFDQYHVGFRKQVREWPVNPVDVIYKKIVKEYSNDKKKEKKEKGSASGGKSKDDGPVRKVVVADFGCGDAKLAARLLALELGNDGHTLAQAATNKKKKARSKDQGVDLCPFKVYSFDLVSGGNPRVTPADMSNVPLPKESVDVGTYCLALMGTNVADFVREAWRVLKFNGVLRVAEVRSRFETASTAAADENKGGGKRAKLGNNRQQKQSKKLHKKDNSPDNGSDDAPPKPLMLLDEFIALMERCGFENTKMDQSNKMFLFMDFIKVDGSKGLSQKERFTAKPCMYKRR